jgi:hypothetical protein
MNNPDCKTSVCTKDNYGNVTAKKQGGNDIRNERKYKGFTIDFIVGSLTIVWNPDDSFFGKFSNFAKAKTAIDDAVKLQ